MKPEERAAIVAYRFEQAKNAPRSVQYALENEDWFTLSNRLYYALFYALSALALVEGFKTSQHTQLIGWFNKNFVATQKVTLCEGQLLKEAWRQRMKGDYDVFVEPDAELLKSMIPQAVDFINRIQSLLNP